MGGAPASERDGLPRPTSNPTHSISEVDSTDAQSPHNLWSDMGHTANKGDLPPGPGFLESGEAQIVAVGDLQQQQGETLACGNQGGPRDPMQHSVDHQVNSLII